MQLFVTVIFYPSSCRQYRLTTVAPTATVVTKDIVSLCRFCECGRHLLIFGLVLQAKMHKSTEEAQAASAEKKRKSRIKLKCKLGGASATIEATEKRSAGRQTLCGKLA